MLIDDTLLDSLAAEAQASPRLRMNRDLRNSPADGSQRMLNALERGTKVPVHRHRGTSETQLLLRGKIDVMFYDDGGRETARLRLCRDEGRYGVDIPAGATGWTSPRAPGTASRSSSPPSSSRPRTAPTSPSAPRTSGDSASPPINLSSGMPPFPEIVVTLTPIQVWLLT